jgi:hypothetical protein
MCIKLVIRNWLLRSICTQKIRNSYRLRTHTPLSPTPTHWQAFHLCCERVWFLLFMKVRVGEVKKRENYSNMRNTCPSWHFCVLMFSLPTNQPNRKQTNNCHGNPGPVQNGSAEYWSSCFWLVFGRFRVWKLGRTPCHGRGFCGFPQYVPPNSETILPHSFTPLLTVHWPNRT